MLKVLLTVPNTGWIKTEVCGVLLSMMSESRVALSIETPCITPYVNSLNQIAKRVLDDGFDFLVSFDADNPPTRNPVDLVLLDLDVVGCPTPVWTAKAGKSRPYYWQAFDAVGDTWKVHAPCEGLQEVDAIGTGCFIVARRVFRAVRAPFNREWDADGIVTVGNDMAFCRRVKAAGFKVWSHFDYPCRHFKEIDLTLPIHAVSRALALANPIYTPRPESERI